MNDYLLSVILGIIEGLTEFLPVSSTAHLRIAEALFGHLGIANVKLDDPYWKMYSIVIQLGAVLCLPVYFWGRIARFASTFPHGEGRRRTVLTHPLSLTILAFLVTAGPCYLAEKLISKNLENLFAIGAALLLGGIAMWGVDAIWDRPRTLSMEQMSLPQAIWIGLAQILSAMFPGTSRSMVTIAAGQVAGMSRASALEFSFFLSLPTMAAATGYKLLQAVLRHGSAGDSPGGAMTAAAGAPAHPWVVLAIGFIVSFLVSLGVVAWFMSWVRRRGFVPFALYRIVLGIGVLLWAAKLMRQG